MVGEAIGNYRISQKLGEGGMGVVYAAVHERIGSKVAIKVLPAEHAKDEGVVARFFNEARAANLVQHPGIAGSIDYGTLQDGSPYIVMEYLEGETLRARMLREGALGLGALRVCRQIAAALSAAHERGLVHRDLKPENVILVRDPEAPGGERAKVLDFGIAKIACDAGGGDMTRTGVLMGTPIYMSPEQCQGARDVGPKGDVYSLGVMLFEMAASALPFRARGIGEMLAMHIYEPPPLVTAYNPAIAPPVEALIAAMLDKDPARRPSMAEVAARLEAQGARATQVLEVPAVLAALELSGPERATVALPGEGAARVVTPRGGVSAPVVTPVGARGPIVTPVGARAQGAAAPGQAPIAVAGSQGVAAAADGSIHAPHAPAPRRLWISFAAAAPILLAAVIGWALLDRRPTPTSQPLPAREVVSSAEPPRAAERGPRDMRPGSAAAPRASARELRETPAALSRPAGTRRLRARGRAAIPPEGMAALPTDDALTPVR